MHVCFHVFFLFFYTQKKPRTGMSDAQKLQKLQNYYYMENEQKQRSLQLFKTENDQLKLLNYSLRRKMQFDLPYQLPIDSFKAERDELQTEKLQLQAKYNEEVQKSEMLERELKHNTLKLEEALKRWTVEIDTLHTELQHHLELCKEHVERLEGQESEWKHERNVLEMQIQQLQNEVQQIKFTGEV
jgi:hypothetical protein